MKKLLSVIAIITVLCFAVTGCGSKTAKTNSSKKSETTDLASSNGDTTDQSTDTSSSSTSTSTSTTKPTTSTTKPSTSSTSTTKPSTSSTSTTKPSTSSTSTTKPSTSSTSTTKPSTTPTTKTFTIDNFISALKAAGLSVQKKGEYAICFGADHEYDLSIDGVGLDVPVYNLNTKNKVALDNIKLAQTQGQMKMNLQPGALKPGQSPYVKAKINGNIAVTSYDKHPDGDKIVKVLMDMK